MTQHERSIIETYKSGLSLRETAQRYGISFIRVWQILDEHEPDAIRKWKFQSTVEAVHRMAGIRRARLARDHRVKSQEKKTEANCIT